MIVIGVVCIVIDFRLKMIVIYYVGEFDVEDVRVVMNLVRENNVTILIVVDVVDVDFGCVFGWSK